MCWEYVANMFLYKYSCQDVSITWKWQFHRGKFLPIKFAWHFRISPRIFLLRDRLIYFAFFFFFSFENSSRDCNRKSLVLVQPHLLSLRSTGWNLYTRDERFLNFSHVDVHAKRSRGRRFSLSLVLARFIGHKNPHRAKRCKVDETLVSKQKCKCSDVYRDSWYL